MTKHQNNTHKVCEFSEFICPKCGLRIISKNCRAVQARLKLHILKHGDNPKIANMQYSFNATAVDMATHKIQTKKL